MEFINEKLSELYETHWSSLCQKFNQYNFCSTKPSNPLLLYVDDRYTIADVKVMYFGQETNSWNGDFSKDIQHLLSSYKDFYITDYCFKYGGQFWNGISKCNKRFQKEFSGKLVGFIWNNLIKIGKSNEKGTPSKDILVFQDECFSMISKEVEILDPDIVIFFTGPNYDQYITKSFMDARFIGHPKRGIKKLAKVTSHSLPDLTLRTYHPNYLWRNGFYDYLDDIVNWILNAEQ